MLLYYCHRTVPLYNFFRDARSPSALPSRFERTSSNVLGCAKSEVTMFTHVQCLLPTVWRRWDKSRVLLSHTPFSLTLLREQREPCHFGSSTQDLANCRESTMVERSTNRAPFLYMTDTTMSISCWPHIRPPA